MKTSLLILSLFFATSKIECQISNQIKQFVKSFYENTYPKADTLLVLKGWQKYSKKEVISALKSTSGNDTLRLWMRVDNERKLIDSFIFLKKEKDSIMTILENQDDISLWDYFEIPNSKFILQDTVTAIFREKGVDIGWWYFRKKYGRRFYNFSIPIFFRNNLLCAFYESYSCGGECGQGNFSIYKLKNGKWEHWFTIHQWES